MPVSVLTQSRAYARRLLKNPFENVRVSAEYFLNITDKPGNRNARRANEVATWMTKNIIPPRGLKGDFKLAPWQMMVVVYMWGLKDVADHTIVGVPRKNGKSTLAASLALAAARFDPGSFPEVVFFAETKEQGDQCFIAAQQLALQMEGEFKSRTFDVHLIDSKGNRAGILQKRALDAKSVLGLNATFIVMDEAALHKSAHYGAVLTGDSSTREWSKILSISTAGRDINNTYKSIGDAAIENIKAGKQPHANPIWFYPPYLKNQRPDHHDPKMWKAANPSLGTVMHTMKDFRKKHDEMCSSGLENDFLIFKMNIWGADSRTNFISLEQAEQIFQDFDEEVFKRNPCCVGIDLGTLPSMTSVALITRENGLFYGKTTNFISRQRLDELILLRDMQWLNRCIEDGELIVDGEKNQTHDACRELIHKYINDYRIKNVTIDRSTTTALFIEGLQKLYGNLINPLTGAGGVRAAAVNVPFQDAIQQGLLRLKPTRLLKAEFDNVCIEPVGDHYYKLTKEYSESPRTIDGVYAVMFGIAPFIDGSGRSITDVKSEDMQELKTLNL